MGERPPWRIEIAGTLGHVIDAEDETVIAIDPDDTKFWGFVVKAVNNHDALVKALADLLALPFAKAELDHLDKGIGTKTHHAAWLCAREALRCVVGGST